MEWAEEEGKLETVSLAIAGSTALGSEGPFVLGLRSECAQLPGGTNANVLVGEGC